MSIFYVSNTDLVKLDTHTKKPIERDLGFNATNDYKIDGYISTKEYLYASDVDEDGYLYCLYQLPIKYNYFHFIIKKFDHNYKKIAEVQGSCPNEVCIFRIGKSYLTLMYKDDDVTGHNGITVMSIDKDFNESEFNSFHIDGIITDVCCVENSDSAIIFNTSKNEGPPCITKIFLFDGTIIKSNESFSFVDTFYSIAAIYSSYKTNNGNVALYLRSSRKYNESEVRHRFLMIDSDTLEITSEMFSNSYNSVELSDEIQPFELSIYGINLYGKPYIYNNNVYGIGNYSIGGTQYEYLVRLDLNSGSEVGRLLRPTSETGFGFTVLGHIGEQLILDMYGSGIILIPFDFTGNCTLDDINWKFIDIATNGMNLKPIITSSYDYGFVTHLSEYVIDVPSIQIYNKTVTSTSYSQTVKQYTVIKPNITITNPNVNSLSFDENKTLSVNINTYGGMSYPFNNFESDSFNYSKIKVSQIESEKKCKNLVDSVEFKVCNYNDTSLNPLDSFYVTLSGEVMNYEKFTTPRINPTKIGSTLTIEYEAKHHYNFQKIYCYETNYYSGDNLKLERDEIARVEMFKPELNGWENCNCEIESDRLVIIGDFNCEGTLLLRLFSVNGLSHTIVIDNINEMINTEYIIDANGDGEHDYDTDIIIPDEYYDITNLNIYIERRYFDANTSTKLYNCYDIRIANPVEGGTPWYNLRPTSDVLKLNWKARYQNESGEVVCSGVTMDRVKNEGWAISGRIRINIPTSYLDSSNRAILVLEIETPTRELITSDKFQINNYSNDYNYKWRYDKEDNDYLYFILDGDYSFTSGWYEPDYAYLYDGEERITSYMSHTISIVDGVATMKVSKSSYDIENIPKHGYWCNFRCSGYGSSNYRGYGGVEKFEFTVKLQIRTTTISQYQFEVTQQNNKIYIANAYFTENVEVYKDGVKLEGSYDKDSGEIKFILPKDTPQLNGHTLNLQYKVFYNDNDEIKSFMQDFTYTTYASYFVELDPDFKDYYWEQLSPTPYNYNYNNGCMVSHGDYIYLVGTAYDNGYKKLLLRYNIESDTWTELASPEYDVYKTKPVVYNNKIYVVGGQTHSTWDRVTKVQIYDIETDSWSYGTDCPRNQGPHELQPIEYNGKIYCFSGYDYDYPSPPNKMDIYDIETDSWESIETPYNLKKYSASCIDGKIYICNGTDSNYNYDTTLYIYDIEANTWTTGPNQPVATYGASHGGGTMLDKFVVILGDFKESVKTMSFDYDISKNKWMRLPDAPNDLGYSYENAKCCRNNNEFYVLKYQYFYRLTKPPVTYSDSYLYELDGVYYTETENGELVETTTQELNEDLFLNEGVSYINSDLIKPNTKVLYFKVENKNEVPQLKYSGVYEGTTIVMDWDLQSEQGKTFNVLGDIYSDDNVRFLLSNDNGQTWKTFDGYEVVSCDINNIKGNGMTYDVFTSLNASQLQSFKGGTNSLRIAIYIEQYSVNGKTNIDHIRLRY